MLKEQNAPGDHSTSNSPVRLIGPCPRVEQLIRAASNELPDSQMTQVLDHVGVCPQCAETWRVAGGSAEAWKKVGAPAAPTPRAVSRPRTAVQHPGGSATPVAYPFEARDSSGVRKRSRIAVPVALALVSLAVLAAVLIPVVRSLYDKYRSASAKIESTRSAFKVATTPAAQQQLQSLTPLSLASELANVSQAINSMHEANARFREEINRPPRGMRVDTVLINLTPPASGNVAANTVVNRNRYRGFTLQVPLPPGAQTLEVLDSLGMTIWTRPIENSRTSVSVKFAGASIPEGSYRLRAIESSRRATVEYPFQVFDAN